MPRTAASGSRTSDARTSRNAIDQGSRSASLSGGPPGDGCGGCGSVWSPCGRDPEAASQADPPQGTGSASTTASRHADKTARAYVCM